VTKYRPQPRSASYSVTEQVGTYATSLSVAVNLGTGAAATARSEAATELVQESSDYAAAPLEHTSPLPSSGAWLEPRVAALEGALISELRKTWFQSACGGAAPSREQAARCLHGSADVPAPALAALSGELGEDAVRLVDLAKPAAR
jgi:hypothetical protein